MAKSPRATILKAIRELERNAHLVETLRDYTKNESGTRLSPFGKAILRAAYEARDQVKAADVAKILDITPGAVSQNYKRFSEEE